MGDGEGGVGQEYEVDGVEEVRKGPRDERRGKESESIQRG